FIDFAHSRRSQERLPEDEAEAEWVSYKEKISHSTDSEDSIRARMDFLLRDLLTVHDGLTLKDARRNFTPQQRLAVYRRDRGVCQVRLRCDGEKVRWDAWHCDHRTPWSSGGKTTVENGQVACPECNQAKGADMPATAAPG
ncbi:MAG: HNH endonuclease, partial [Acidobacteria bacterium]|nr:HNH endonuclease [Acidobacteriota bacterium]